MVTITLDVENCADCPYYEPSIYNCSNHKATYGVCNKINGKGKNEDLIEFCPFKEKKDKCSKQGTLKNSRISYCQKCGAKNDYIFKYCNECGTKLRKHYDNEKEILEDFKNNHKYYCKRCENYTPSIQECWGGEDIEYDESDKKRKSPYKKGCKKFNEKPLKLDEFRKLDGNFDFGVIFWFIICTSPVWVTVTLMVCILLGLV